MCPHILLLSGYQKLLSRGKVSQPLWRQQGQLHGLLPLNIHHSIAVFHKIFFWVVQTVASRYADCTIPDCHVCYVPYRIFLFTV